MGRAQSKLRGADGYRLIAMACLLCIASASGTAPALRGGASSAQAQQNAQQAVEGMNREAMEAYNALDINKAGSILEEALRIAFQGGVAPQLAARTALNLGIVYIGGLNDQDNGLNYFTQALCTDPSVQLDPLTSSPDIQNVFNVASQRARGGACPTGPPQGPPMGPMVPVGPPPPPPPPPPDQAFVHTPPAEQLTQTPLPIYVEISPLAQAHKITLYYKGLGMQQFKAVPMYQYQSGFAYQISCESVWEPGVSYYIEAHSADGRIVGVYASAAQPVQVPVVSGRKQAEPALPGTQPPASCSAKECPPGVSGCKKKGKSGIDEACGGDKDCQSGLECSSDKCALIGAGGTDVPVYNPQTGGYGGSEPGGAADSGKFRPTFVQLGLAVGMAYVQAGMVADHGPPVNRIFLDPTGNFVADPVAAGTAGQMLTFAEPGTPNEAKLTSWVPDADSADSMGPLGGNCTADKKATGPGQPAGLFPSRYCVRVKSPGFVPNLALRAAIGRFVTDKISVAALLRFQFSAGQGTLSHMLIGARGEYMLSDPKVKGLMISGFAGFTFGEIQAQPPADGTTKGAPYVKSGLMGVHAGANFRYRISPNFGLFAAPELDVQLPTTLFNLDFTLAGVEAAF